MVFTVTLRTKPSLSFCCTSTIRASSQQLRGQFTSTTKTMWPMTKFLLGRLHFCLSWRDERYSLIHLRQNTFARYWICHHCLQEYISSFWKNPGGSDGPERSKSRWFGIRVSKSFGSSDTLVTGLPLTIDSTSHIKVTKPSLSRICSFVRALMTFLTVLMHRSQTPPWWDPPGGLKVHFTFCCSRNSPILCGFQPAIASRSFFSPRTKFPLSDLTSSGWPLRAINRRIALIKESVSRLWETFKWIARMDRQVKRTPYLLTKLLPLCTRNGAKQSITSLLTAVLALRIQNFPWITHALNPNDQISSGSSAQANPRHGACLAE